MRRFGMRAAGVGVLWGLLLVPAAAQGRSGASNAPTRHSARLCMVFAPAVAKAYPATAQVFVAGRRVALATVVRADGVLVTKASELGEGAVEVGFGGDGPRYPARRIGVDDPNDLAVLRIDRRDLPAVEFAVSNATRTGSFVVTAAPEVAPVAYGVMSVARHPRPMPNQNLAFLGVRSEQSGPSVRLVEIVEDSAAARAGLQKGDVVVAVDGNAVASPQHLSGSIRRKKPGDEIQVEIRRADQTIALAVTLGRNNDRHGAISSQERSRLWGPLSGVRLGFEEVIQHDTVLRPEDCGGPLCNLAGEVVGVNIARVGRFETLALTAKVVARSVARILARVPAGGKGR